MSQVSILLLDIHILLVLITPESYINSSMRLPAKSSATVLAMTLADGLPWSGSMTSCLSFKPCIEIPVCRMKHVEWDEINPPATFRKFSPSKTRQHACHVKVEGYRPAAGQLFKWSQTTQTLSQVHLSQISYIPSTPLHEHATHLFLIVHLRCLFAWSLRNPSMSFFDWSNALADKKKKDNLRTTQPRTRIHTHTDKHIRDESSQENRPQSAYHHHKRKAPQWIQSEEKRCITQNSQTRPEDHQGVCLICLTTMI